MDEEEEDKELLKIRIETLKTMIGKLKRNSLKQSFKISEHCDGSLNNNAKKPDLTFPNPIPRSKMVNQSILINNKYKFNKTHSNNALNQKPMINTGARHYQTNNNRFKWDKNYPMRTAIYTQEHNVVSVGSLQHAPDLNRAVGSNPSFHEVHNSRTITNKFKLVKDNVSTGHNIDHRKVPTRTSGFVLSSHDTISSFQTARKHTGQNRKTFLNTVGCKYKFLKENTCSKDKVLFKQASSNLYKWQKDQKVVVSCYKDPSFIERRVNFMRKTTNEINMQMKHRQLAQILSHMMLIKRNRKESFTARRLKFVKTALIQPKNSSLTNKTNSNVLNSPNKDLILSRHGTHYKVAGNLKSLRRINTIELNKKKAHSVRKDKFRKLSTSVKRKVARRVLKRSLTVSQRKKVKKTKFCLFFNRFGKCNRENECKYIHDPEKVAVCTRFLRGTCQDEKCLFSHKVDPKKMPVCSYFLLGTCTNEKCPYSHVNVSDKAEVCQDFLKGYCAQEEKCTKKHILDCIDFTTTGNCPLGKKCPMNHRFSRKNKRRRSSSLSGTRKPKCFQVKKMKLDQSPISSQDLVGLSKEIEKSDCTNHNLDSPLRNKGRLHLLPKFISDKLSQSYENPTSFSVMRNLFNFDKKDSSPGEDILNECASAAKANASFIPSDSESVNEKQKQRRFSMKEQDFIAL